MKNSTAKAVGSRIRTFRLHLGMTQEELAEKAELHNTYIGQVERGEKNLTIASMEKILSALGLTFEEFFAHMGLPSQEKNYAEQCYDLVSQKTVSEQAHLLRILQEIVQFSADK